MIQRNNEMEMEKAKEARKQMFNEVKTWGKDAGSKLFTLQKDYKELLDDATSISAMKGGAVIKTYSDVVVTRNFERAQNAARNVLEQMNGLREEVIELQRIHLKMRWEAQQGTQKKVQSLHDAAKIMRDQIIRDINAFRIMYRNRERI